MVEIVVVVMVVVFQIFVRVDVVGEVIFHPGVVLLDVVVEVNVVDVNVCSVGVVVSNVVVPVVHQGGHVLLGVGVVYTVVVESVGGEEVVVKLDVELQFVQGKSKPYCGDGKPEEKMAEEIEVFLLKNDLFSNNLKQSLEVFYKNGTFP